MGIFEPLRNWVDEFQTNEHIFSANKFWLIQTTNHRPDTGSFESYLQTTLN